LGDISFSIDGVPLDFADTVTYRGMMFSAVPNLVWVFGYFRASWTLRVDLVSDFVNRMLLHMDELGATRVTPRLRPEDLEDQWPRMGRRGVLQSQLFDAFDAPHAQASGQAGKWRHTQDYWGRTRRTCRWSISTRAVWCSSE